MRKRNTMLLTVIAVATLLVAVVGATFAYFSLSVSGEAKTITATTTTGKLGVFTIDQNAKNNLSLSITAEDMAQSLIDDNTKSIDYFVGSDKKITKSNSSDMEQGPDDSSYITINKLTLSDADNGTKYHCQGLYTITASIKENSDGKRDVTSDLKSQVQEKDGKLYLKTKGDNKVTVNIAEDEDNAPADSGAESIDHSLQSLLSESKKFWVTYDFESIGSNLNAELQVAFKISNVGAEQNYLANKEITVTLTPDVNNKLACNITKE